MNQYSDAALLKGQFAKLLKNPPKEEEWMGTSCANGAEQTAQSLAKQLFSFQKSLDPAKEKLEVITFSALGPIKVMSVIPIEGDLMRIDGLNPSTMQPVSMLQHIQQLSFTITKGLVQSENPEESPDDDDGMQIGFVIFDELKKRAEVRGIKTDDVTKKKDTSKS